MIGLDLGVSALTSADEVLAQQSWEQSLIYYLDLCKRFHAAKDLALQLLRLRRGDPYEGGMAKRASCNRACRG